MLSAMLQRTIRHYRNLAETIGMVWKGTVGQGDSLRKGAGSGIHSMALSENFSNLFELEKIYSTFFP